MPKTTTYNDGTRTLIESTLVQEVAMALRDFSALEGSLGGVLIGGAAVSYYVKPRKTPDIDFLYLRGCFPHYNHNFRKLGTSTLLHLPSDVLIEFFTPGFLSAPYQLADLVLGTSNLSSGTRVASPEALITLKTYRFSRQDKADIEALMSCRPGDLTKWLPLASNKSNRLAELRKIYDDSNSSFTWKF
jgi:hypothetical protein